MHTSFTHVIAVLNVMLSDKDHHGTDMIQTADYMQTNLIWQVIASGGDAWT